MSLLLCPHLHSLFDVITQMFLQLVLCFFIKAIILRKCTLFVTERVLFLCTKWP